MKCRDFEIEVAEWVRERTSPAVSQALAMHESGCAKCRQLAEAERQIRIDLSALPSVDLARDLWPSMLDRLYQPKPVRHGWLALTKWAMAGVAAAILGVAVFKAIQPPAQIAMAKPEDEARIARMMADAQMIQYVEKDLDTFGIYRGHEAQRALLVGDVDRK